MTGARAHTDREARAMAMATVYRVFNARGELLYVGVTKRAVAQRLRGHRSASAWWPEASYLTVEHYATRDEAHAAELQAILTEHPVHNVAVGSGRFGSTLR